MDENTKEFFNWFGVEIPKSEHTITIDDDVQKDADTQFMVYSAYLKAGFNSTEALTLLQGMISSHL